MDDSEWTDVAVIDGNWTPVGYLISAGLSETEAKAVVDIAGASSMKDLLLLVDHDMLSEIVNEAGLKLIPAKKLSNAIKALVKRSDSSVTKKEHHATISTTGSNPVPHIFESNQPPDECVVINIDHSGSMGSVFDEARAFGPNAEKTLTHRSRMDAVKQCFYAFRDRIETLDTNHKLGLVQFDDKIEVLLALTADLDKFEAVVDDMRPRGSTAIYSSIIKSCQILKPYSKNAKTDLRVLVLTDG